MFAIWKRKDTEVIQYWYVLFDNFETPASEFYQAIEHDLVARELTGMEISRVEYAEGGALSARREYLRMRRERLIFDICAAPFGTAWFFSCRFAEIPLTIFLWEVIIVLFVLAAVVWFYTILFGLIFGSILFAASLLSLLLLMRNTVALGMQDVDAALLQIPVIGGFYEVFIRKPTYYREDTRHAYINIVNSIVRSRINELGEAIKRPVVYNEAPPEPKHPGILRIFSELLGIGRKP
jgi:hypothetical protein